MCVFVCVCVCVCAHVCVCVCVSVYWISAPSTMLVSLSVLCAAGDQVNGWCCRWDGVSTQVHEP